MKAPILYIITIAFISVSFFFLGYTHATTQTKNTEYITDQQYKNTSLQYMEDMRNALDAIQQSQQI